jgi:hypothetical protein
MRESFLAKYEYNFMDLYTIFRAKLLGEDPVAEEQQVKE